MIRDNLLYVYILAKNTEFNVDFNAKDEHQLTAFHWACANGNLEIAKMLLTKFLGSNNDFNTKGKYDITYFFSACQNKRLEVAYMLIENSTELNIELNKELNDISSEEMIIDI